MLKAICILRPLCVCTTRASRYTEVMKSDLADLSFKRLLAALALWHVLQFFQKCHHTLATFGGNHHRHMAAAQSKACLTP